MSNWSKLIIVFTFFSLVSVGGCSLFNKKDKAQKTQTVNLDTVEVGEQVSPWLPVSYPYRPANTKYFDLIHTKLEIKPDFTTETMPGVATITLKPHFYDQNTLVLDAKYMKINSVKVNGKTVSYTYDSLKIKINLDKTYSAEEQITVVIDYVSQPNRVPIKGSRAITSDKGLYFINAQGNEPNKPTQLWTQGETEAASCWFPTIDSPNQRSAHDIYLTVDKKYTTLSNGILVEQKEEGNWRTDHWQQKVPIAPYLFMIAVGEFYITKDKWRNIEVNYYLEKDYHPYAKAIFGDTPEMIEFFSNRLGVEYPWDKYHQIVVRDYVSGAMENVGAVIHGEFVQKDDRALLDEHPFDIIAHELFHHWFGDLVTCESWSNLPLNESFATYGEYLWREYKYGRMSADAHLEEDLLQYLQEAQSKREPLIRYHYDYREDMFDAHSYQKGGLVLHMLRHTVGDKAFFKALQLYLEKNKFKSVEIHDLRLAFEEVTGEDLNWFFDQWFLQRGHPEIIIQYGYDDNKKVAMVRLHQVQDERYFPKAYRLKSFVDMYFEQGKVKNRIPVDIFTRDTIVEIPCEKKPEYITFDPENTLLMHIREDYTNEDYRYILRHDPTFRNRFNAMRHLDLSEYEAAEPEIFMTLSDSTSEELRYQAIHEYAFEKDGKTFVYKGKNKDNVIAKLKEIAQKDKSAKVRNAAVQVLSMYADKEMLPLFENCLNDRSYNVFRSAMQAIITLDHEKGYAIANRYREEKNPNIIIAVAKAIAESQNPSDFEWMDTQMRRLANAGDENCYSMSEAYTQYITKVKLEDKSKAIETLKYIIDNKKTWWTKIAAVSALTKFKKEPGVQDYLNQLRKTENNFYIQMILSQ
ncbi:MAG: M1 family metallopeptidase [Bacteroidia bacterium]|nr:M1 family metallopeptidase [Bacteroidia bacterium]MDW8301088.1 M1 family metallopeptidase [Bacteroidia bacterium]